jgi:hypothetical protein
MGSRFPLSRVSTWDQFWKDYIIKKVIEFFGATDPKPTVDQQWIWRLVYCPSHNKFVVQSQIPPATGAGTWTNVSTEDGEPTSGSGPALTHFNFDWEDFFEGERLYDCPTVVGMHFGSASGYSIARYDYEDLGHDRLTGSVDFQRRGCGCNQTPKPKRDVRESTGCGGLAYTPPDDDCPNIPLSDISLGWNIDPCTRALLSGADLAKTSNWILTNKYLCDISDALRALNHNMGELINAVDDFRVSFETIMQQLLARLGTVAFDTSGIERKITELTQKIDDIGTIQF